MNHNLTDTVALLARTPAAFSALLCDMPDIWTQRNEGKDSWTAFGVVGHLVHSERVAWLPRVRMILQFGETRTFEPLMRAPNEETTRGKSLGQLLDEFAQVRAENLAELRALNLQPEDLARSGRHPTFGKITLSQLLATWAAHDLTHLHQVSRVMAHQYREAVGPFIAFLGVLKCDAHSAPA
jgi:DinB superfamily